TRRRRRTHPTESRPPHPGRAKRKCPAIPRRSADKCPFLGGRRPNAVHSALRSKRGWAGEITTGASAGKARTAHNPHCINRSRWAGTGTSQRLSISRTQQTADLLSLPQDRNGDPPGVLGAAAQHRIDIAEIAHQPAHLAPDSPQYLDGQLGEGFLEY